MSVSRPSVVTSVLGLLLLTPPVAADSPDVAWIQAAHPYAATAFVWSPDGTLVASGSSTTKIWNAVTGALVRELPSVGASLAFSPNGQFLATAYGTAISLWNIATGALIETMDEFNNAIVTLAWSPDGQLIAAGDEWSKTKILSAVTYEVVREFNAYSESVAFSPNGQYLAGGGQNGFVRIWNVTTGQIVIALGWGAALTDIALAFSPDGQAIVAGGGSLTGGKLNWWRVSDWTLVHQVPTAHTDSVTCVAFSPDGQTLLTGGREATMKVWRTSDHALLATWDQQTGSTSYWPYSGPRQAAFAPDGLRFGYGLDSGSIVVARREYFGGDYQQNSIRCQQSWNGAQGTGAAPAHAVLTAGQPLIGAFDGMGTGWEGVLSTAACIPRTAQNPALVTTSQILNLDLAAPFFFLNGALAGTPALPAITPFPGPFSLQFTVPFPISFSFQLFMVDAAAAGGFTLSQPSEITVL